VTEGDKPADWPTLPDEHPELPYLVAELHPALAPSGKIPGRPAMARILLSPVRVLQTSNPDRLRAIAADLLELADDLARAHGSPPAPEGQQSLDLP